ncbi:hypothetical protein [Streptomyces sp. MZ04]|uniref:hypothetical protein n=1 Tax=Streptomyces sp. MZ04 TaxID=2559236 RepID=UPI00143291E1|nr:hypothetical protein [Streptomyces sp. MZ04]
MEPHAFLFKSHVRAELAVYEADIDNRLRVREGPAASNRDSPIVFGQDSPTS